MTLQIFRNEFDKTNRAYLEELNQEYDPKNTGEDVENVFGSLFVSADEISKQLEKSETILMNYPTENLEFFSKAIDEVRDRHQLIELRKALEAMKQFYNVARLLGHRELLNKIDINRFQTLLNVISRRLLTFIYDDRRSDENN